MASMSNSETRTAVERPRRWVLPLSCAVVLLLLAVTLVAAIHARSMEACDDAFISFRMARNLAEGHGLRFNPDGPAVEAASNFLLTVALAGAHRVGLSILQSSLGIAVASAVLTLLLLAWAVRRSCGPWGAWAPAALATMTIFQRNMVNGLETSMFGLLLLAAVVLYVRSQSSGRGALRGRRALFLSSTLFALVSMTRPEGPMYMVALGLLRLLDLARRRRRGDPSGLKGEAIWAGGFFLLYLPYFAWRLVYFGKLLPNTYYAKEVFFSSALHKLQIGAIYLEVMSLLEPLLLVSILAGTWLLLVAPSKRVRTLLAVVAAQTLFLVLSGGDWSHMFGYGRFLCPALPMVLWLLAEAAVCLAAPGRYARFTDAPDEVAGMKARRPVLVGLAVGLLLLSQVNLLQASGLRLPPQFHLLQDRPAPLTRQAVARAYLTNLRREPMSMWLGKATSSFRMSRYDGTFDALAGMWLRDRYGADTRMASIQAGQFAYWSGMPMFDLFGLTTPDVARTRRDTASLFDKLTAFNPKIIAFYRWGNDLHHRDLVKEGSLWRAGYGLRYVLQSGTFRAFLVFEKGYPARVDPVKILHTSLKDLPYTVDPEQWIALLSDRHPRLWP